MSGRVHVKFCGLVRRVDLRRAVELGADFVGVVFVPGTPRGLAPRAAERLLDLDTRQARRVGVFRDQPAMFVNDMVRRCRLDLVQLHGHEPRDFPSAVEVPVLRMLPVRAAPGRARAARSRTGAGPARPRPRGSKPAARRTPRAAAAQARVGWRVPLAPNVFAALLDAQAADGSSGGLGLRTPKAALASALEMLPPDTRVFLSGGLTPENVRARVRAVHPYAVDVSSGVETAPGIKDPQRMRAFVRALEAWR